MTFSRVQLLFVLILFIGISNHVLIVPHLLGAAKRDAWVCVLISYVILLAWGGLITYILSKNKQRLPLFLWLKERTGRHIPSVLMTLFFLYIVVIGFISFFDLIASVKIYFMPMTPTWVVVIPFLVLSVWAALKGLKMIVYTSIILLPLVWILGHFVAFTTIESKRYSFLFPIFADEQASIIQGVVIILGGSVDLLVLFLLHHYFNKPVSYGFIVLLITILAGLIIGPTMGALAAFGPNVAADLRFPAFEQWRLVTIGDHVSHVDALAVLQLLCGTIIRISLCLYLLPDLLRINSSKLRYSLIIIPALGFGTLMVMHISDIWMQTTLKMYFYPFAFLFGIVMTWVLLIISFLPKKKGLTT
ncbi:spore germination protein GerXB [Alkalihalophilus pseudofirmus OF4]|uniref:Spore germination protein GerXB n=1 Tax=Alkalihalophilus pseudofirmus (strain ATCC BAA-2126 / JCM 17055 / OF4) TaxID=398511 RepID=D3FQK6_ALKPO|nr:endospore germination permease [Alkalihalophilus pseudofirmus]ADC51376.1 spore germination protein GerXB [Alkalihalophilus pseudofirmus OF4]